MPQSTIQLRTASWRFLPKRLRNVTEGELAREKRIRATIGKGTVVAVGRTRTSARHAWVDPDFEAAVEGAAQCLVALGHRRIGLALPDLSD